MLMRRFCLTLFLFVLPVCAGDLPRADLDRITADALKSHVAFLASDLLEGRGTPSRGLDIAGEYIAAQFMRAGLAPAAGETGYFQNAEFVQVTTNLQGAEITIEADGQRISVPAAGIGVMGAQASGVNVENVEAVKVSTGSDVDPQSVAGKVVLAELPDFSGAAGADARRKAFESFRRLRAGLSDAKPAAVVLVGATAPSRPPRPMRRLVSAEDAGVLWLQAGDAALSKAVREGKTFRATVKLPEPEREPVKLRNVAGIIPGSDPKLKDTYVMVSAHYDHIGMRPSGDGDRIMNGANDDASGTASLIEIAEALAHAKPRRSVLFIAWFGEEMGLLGSRYYARHPLVPVEKTVADINLEQTGRTDDPKGPALNRAGLTGSDFSDVAKTFAEAGAALGVRFIDDPAWGEDYFARSDNISLAELGIPAHTMSVVLEYPDYHRPGDEWDKLDYANMEKITRFIAEGVAIIAGRDQAPQWNAANPKAARYAEVQKQGARHAGAR